MGKCFPKHHNVHTTVGEPAFERQQQWQTSIYFIRSHSKYSNLSSNEWDSLDCVYSLLFISIVFLFLKAGSQFRFTQVSMVTKSNPSQWQSVQFHQTSPRVIKLKPPCLTLYESFESTSKRSSEDV